jgi:hypothetical protein
MLFLFFSARQQAVWAATILPELDEVITSYVSGDNPAAMICLKAAEVIF